jgi:FkbH-like protein
MYETEINQPAPPAELFPELRDAFRSWSRMISGKTVLPWGEHCTECVWPTCYQSCDLYVPRKDGKCRRFEDGMVRIKHTESLNGYILKLRFKRWAKLWTTGNTRIFPLNQAKALEDSDLAIAEQLRRIPNTPLQIRYISERYNDKKKWALQPAPAEDEQPDYFLVECYNPSARLVSVSLVMRATAPPHAIPFQYLMKMEPGFNHVEVPLTRIRSVLNTAEPFGIEIIPNNAEDELVLYFGTIDFVRDLAYIAPAAPCKVVVWDLDNTLWDGTLSEDGSDKIALKPGMRELLAELDQRGILLSVASKNDPEEAFMALQLLHLEEYFLYPQISWGPKSEAVSLIAEALNVGLDSIVFIDDSTFERTLVESACPGVRVIDATEYQSLLMRPEFQGETTREGASRRQLYGQQQLREASRNTFEGTYLEFLRDCHLELLISGVSAANLNRVHELTQRTNQMNFSGNRYTRQELEAIVSDKSYDSYAIDCRDRFGNYGTIGFCVVNRQARLIIDLMFSCRVQSKRVEHAFLAYLLQIYRASKPADFYVNYRRTPRNAHLAKVFEDLSFEQLDDKDGASVFVFRAARDISHDNIVTVVAPLAR